MRRYVAVRLLQFIPSLLGVSIAVFVLLRIMPGDVASLILLGQGGGVQPREEDIIALRHQLGLDVPIHVQYVDWLWGLVRLDPGRSLFYDVPIRAEILRTLPVTAELIVLTLAVSLAISIPLGVLSAIRQNTWLDHALRVFSVAGLSMPTFWSGTLVLLFLVTLFNWIPPLGISMLWEDPWANVKQMVLPALTLGYFLSAMTSRMVRSAMVEVLREDYVRTAWAKGLRERVVVLRHAFRNASLPVVSLVGVQFAIILGGTVVIEQIFTLPGIASDLVNAIFHRDYPMVEAVVMLFAFLILAVNLVIDMMYAWLDPRIRYT
ncbi:MAG: ABC transporter permease [Chloroflexi bacterium]|nr:ABC transporter permease [Chloroflexota bacterium]